MLDIAVSDLDFNTIRIRDANGSFVEHDLKAELVIDKNNLAEEFKLQPSKYVYWASILEQVRAYLEAAQFTEDKTKADLYEPARLAIIQGGTPKPTKDQIESWVWRQDVYLEAKQQVMVYSKFVKQLQYVVKAFEQRRDMLTQIGADMRKQKEYENNLNLM